ncbi:unnamed protein product [Adineta steineri]|uniref:Uncharacterized protein n=2 Tax=Adineta steineri TaxID=433720 RepID=A0A815MXD4_9BILA|nr:unnamed protein product [Adineta steineri]
MKVRYLEPVVEFRLSNGNLPFKTTTTAGLSHREVQCIDDHKLQLDQVITAPMPKILLDISIPTHWLAIEGKQPTINENLEIISKADLTTDSLNPTIDELLFSIIRALGDRIVKSCENSSVSPIDKITIDRINDVISKYIPPAYCTSHSTPDHHEHFKEEISNFSGQS